MSTEATPVRECRRSCRGVRKFMFERSFDDATCKKRMPPRDRRPVPYTQDQIDAIKKEAQDAGFATGKKAGIDEMAQKLNVTVDQIAASIARLLETGRSSPAATGSAHCAKPFWPSRARFCPISASAMGCMKSKPWSPA